MLVLAKFVFVRNQMYFKRKKIITKLFNIVIIQFNSDTFVQTHLELRGQTQ